MHQALGHPWIKGHAQLPEKPLSSIMLTRLKQFTQMSKLKCERQPSNHPLPPASNTTGTHCDCPPRVPSLVRASALIHARTLSAP